MLEENEMTAVASSLLIYPLPTLNPISLSHLLLLPQKISLPISLTMSLMDDDFDIDSACSTPYVSAPSSPGRSSSGSAAGAGGGFFYSAPASPMHFILSSSALTPPPKTSPEASVSAPNSFEFEFSARFPSAATADELFLNGQIRPMKLSSHLQRPQILAPLIDLDESEPDPDNAAAARGRGEAKWRDRSLRRRSRSMSPLRTSATWHEINEKREEVVTAEAEDETPSMSASSSRSSSGNRSSKRWIFLKEFLYRSKSEGRNNSHKFWNTFSFSAVKDKKSPDAAAVSSSSNTNAASVSHSTLTPSQLKGKKKAGPTNGVGKRRVPASPHEIHYRANRAQAEEMRKKTFLPYRQGLIGCLGFSSKSYGAVNGLARALNPVSSR